MLPFFSALKRGLGGFKDLPRHHQMQEINDKNGNRNNFAIFAGLSITKREKRRGKIERRYRNVGCICIGLSSIARAI